MKFSLDYTAIFSAYNQQDKLDDEISEELSHRKHTVSVSSNDSSWNNCSSISISTATPTITTTAATLTDDDNNTAGTVTLSTNPTHGNKSYKGGHYLPPHHHYQQHKTRHRPRQPEPGSDFRFQPSTTRLAPSFCDVDRRDHCQQWYQNYEYEHLKHQEQPLCHRCCCCCCCCARGRLDDDRWGGATTPISPHPHPFGGNDVSVVCLLLKCNNTERGIISTQHYWDVRGGDSAANIKIAYPYKYSHPKLCNNNINNNNNNNNKNNNNNNNNINYNIDISTNVHNNNNNNNNNINNKCFCHRFPLDVNSEETLLDASDTLGQRFSGPDCVNNKSDNLGSSPEGDPNRSRDAHRSFAKKDKITNGHIKTKQDFCERGTSFDQVFPHTGQHRKFTHEMLGRYTPSQTRWLKYSLFILFALQMIFAPTVLAYPRPNVIEKANKTVVIFYTAPCRPLSTHQLRRQLGEAYDEERMADSEENVKRSVQMSTISPTEDEQSNDAEIDEYFNDNVQGDAPGSPVDYLEDDINGDEDAGDKDEDDENDGMVIGGEAEDDSDEDDNDVDDDSDEDDDNDDEDGDYETEEGKDGENDVNDDDDEHHDSDEKRVVTVNGGGSMQGQRSEVTDTKDEDESISFAAKNDGHLVGARRDRRISDQKNSRLTRKKVVKRPDLVGGKKKKKQSKPIGRRGPDRTRTSSRDRRDVTSTSSRNQTRKAKGKVMLSLKYRGQPSLNRRRVARAAELSNNWHCEMKTEWKKMQNGYFPSYLQTGRCISKSCFFNMYKCIPKKYTIKVLKRDPNRCNPIPTYGLNTTYEERWIFERFHVTVFCQCGSSKRKSPRRRKKKRPRHR